MKHYCDYIPLTLAEKLKEKGMPMDVWNSTVQGIPYIAIMEKSSYDWLDVEMGILEPQMVERRYSIPTYAEVFDWLMEKNTSISIDESIHHTGWFVRVNGYGYETEFDTWHEAANAAIEKALELI